MTTAPGAPSKGSRKGLRQSKVTLGIEFASDQISASIHRWKKEKEKRSLCPIKRIRCNRNPFFRRIMAAYLKIDGGLIKTRSRIGFKQLNDDQIRQRKTTGKFNQNQCNKNIMTRKKNKEIREKLGDLNQGNEKQRLCKWDSFKIATWWID